MIVSMDEVKTRKHGNPWVMWGFVIFIVLVLLAMAVPMTMR